MGGSAAINESLCSKREEASMRSIGLCAFIVLLSYGCGGKSTTTPGSSAGGTGAPSASGAGATSTGAASSGSPSTGSGGSKAGTLPTGAGGAGGSGPAGVAGSGPAVGGTGGAAAGAMGACPSYPSTSIAAIRNPPVASGCYELSHVGLVARTDSPTEPRIYVQDAGGGDFSAMDAKCTTTATHACPASVKSKISQLADTAQAGAQISVRGYFVHGTVGGFEQFYIEDLVDEGKTVPRPAPIALSVADIKRDARTPAKWFRRANVTIPAQDPLVMYDFSPTDLQLAGSTACPNYAGFAMIPMSAGVAAPSACMGTMNPASRALDPNEVLIGRQFFNQFLFSTDCGCMAGTSQKPLTPTSSISGTGLGYLIIEQDKGSTAAYQVFEPAADQTFTLK
jgi:hypothetical protein